MVYNDLDDPRIMSASEAASRWGITDARLRQLTSEFPKGSIRKFGKQWVVTEEGMETVFGKPREEKKMKLYWACHENYQNEVGFYPALNADDLMERLALITEKTPEYIRKNYLYAEIDLITDEKYDKKYRVKLIEQE
ncbi:helix-turn-helix domain-containing protein [Paenibacillus elgii]|uniref:helix-turn-helix domain-containing protein n=1 Tax=Paenibacillus elgii TaxID=189691 RepID=UPI000248C7CC|nr:helix-turn-helix domain-containing protein [Paenibacillus elgii]